MKYIFLLLLVLLASSCECIDEDKIVADAMCSQDWIPVCGCDNKTYSNECEAASKGVTSWANGECSNQ